MNESAPVDLSPDGTHLRVSLSKAIIILGAVIAAASGAAVSWGAVTSELHSHEANVYVHLDPKFAFQHGAPVGEWDLGKRDDATARGFAALQAQVSALQAAEQARKDAAESRKPRWRP